jgi:hypothetical protein
VTACPTRSYVHSPNRRQSQLATARRLQVGAKLPAQLGPRVCVARRRAIPTQHRVPRRHRRVPALSHIPLRKRRRHGPKVRSHRRFRNRGTDYLTGFGVKWLSGSKKRQCGRALQRPSVARVLGVLPPGREAPPRVISDFHPCEKGREK